MRLKPSKNKIKKITFDKIKPSGVAISSLIQDGTVSGTDGSTLGTSGSGLSEKAIVFPIIQGAVDVELYRLDGDNVINLEYGSDKSYIAEDYTRIDNSIRLALFDTPQNPVLANRYRLSIWDSNNNQKYQDFNLGMTNRGLKIATLDANDFIEMPSSENNRPQEQQEILAQPLDLGGETISTTISEPQTTDLTISPFMPCGKLYINGIEQDIQQSLSYGDNVAVVLRAIPRGSKQIRIVAGDTPASVVTWERTVDVTGPTQTITPDNFGYLVINGFEPGWALKINNVVRSCKQQNNTHYAVSSLGLKDIEVENNDGGKYSFKFNVVAGRNEIDMADYNVELPTMDLTGGNTDPNAREPRENTGNNTGNNTGENPPIRNPPRDNTNRTPPRDNTSSNRTPPREESNRNTGVGRNTNTGNNTSNNTNTETTQSEQTLYGTVTINGLPSGSIVVITQGTKRKELRPDSSGNVTDSRIETGTWNVKVTENGSPRNSMDRTIVVEQGRVALIDYSTNNTTPEEVSRLVIYLNEGKSVVMRGPGGEVVRETPVRGSIEIDGLADGNWEITIMQGDRELEKRTVRIQKGQTVEIEIDPRETGIGVRREGEIAATEEGSNLVYWILGIGVVGGIGYYYRKEISKFLGLDKVDVAAKEKVEVKK
jgi:hypothetical protein